MIHHYLVTDEHQAIKKLRKRVTSRKRSNVSSCLFKAGRKRFVNWNPYEKNTKCWALNGMDWKFDMELLEPELDRIEEHLEYWNG